MPLTLHPDIDSLSRLDLERHLENIQLRRLTATVVYYEGQNAKYQSKVDKADRRLVAKYETLGKKLQALEKMIEAVEKLANNITEIKNGRDQNQSMIQYLDKESGDRDDAE